MFSDISIDILLHFQIFHYYFVFSKHSYLNTEIILIRVWYLTDRVCDIKIYIKVFQKSYFEVMQKFINANEFLFSL